MLKRLFIFNAVPSNLFKIPVIISSPLRTNPSLLLIASSSFFLSLSRATNTGASAVSWEDWWTYEGISGEPINLIGVQQCISLLFLLHLQHSLADIVAFLLVVCGVSCLLFSRSFIFFLPQSYNSVLFRIYIDVPRIAICW